MRTRMFTALAVPLVLWATTIRPATARMAKIEETSAIVGDSNYAVRTAAMIATGKALASARSMGMSTFTLRRAVLRNGKVSVEVVATDDAAPAKLEWAPVTPVPTDALPDR